MTCYLTGFGSAVPGRVVTNAELAPRLGVEPDWIERASGIRERRWVTTTETTSALATEASRAALADAGLDAAEVDYLVCATMSPDYQIPGIAPLVQRALDGCRSIPALDIRVGCCAVLYCVDMARSLLATGAAMTVLCAAAEAQSKGLDLSPESAEISMLFGDGAAAIVARRDPGPSGGLAVEDVLVETDGAFAEALAVRAPGTANGARWWSDDLDARSKPVMDGRTVILQAVRRLTDAATRICERNGVRPSEVDLVVPHQANGNLLRTLATRLDVDPERVVTNLDRYGNTGGASAFLALDEAWHTRRPEPDRLVLVLAFGSGFTWGAGLLRASS